MSVSALQVSPGLPARSLPPSSQSARNEGQTASKRESETSKPAVEVSLSEAGQRLARASEAKPEQDSKPELAPDEKREVEKLRKRDREVRAHEAAHKAAAGSLSSGGASFSFTRGPDGRRYATSGEVSIDTSAVSGDPDATIRKMLQVRSAALAPASPSGQDRKVAAQASSKAQAARAEASQEKLEKSEPEANANANAAAAPSSEIAANTDETDETSQGENACSMCGGQGHGPEVHYSKR